jgi:hypothetical protein
MGLALKHILQISLERDMLWPTAKEKAPTLGIGVETAPIGRQVSTWSNRQSQHLANSVTNVRPSETLELVEVDLS